MKPAPPDPPEVTQALWDGVGGLIAWDVGANCGQTLPTLLSRFAVVIAFEPAQECFPWLERFERATVLPYAVSDTEGTVDLVALTDKIDTGQLVTAGTVGMEWNPGDPTGTVRTVKSTTLDRIAAELGPPDFVKVDVEGHEAKVLAGAKDLLLHGSPQEWLVEFHSPELYKHCQNTFKEAGYRVEVIRHPHYEPLTAMWFQHGWMRAKL